MHTICAKEKENRWQTKKLYTIEVYHSVAKIFFLKIIFPIFHLKTQDSNKIDVPNCFVQKQSFILVSMASHYHFHSLYQWDKSCDANIPVCRKVKSIASSWIDSNVSGSTNSCAHLWKTGCFCLHRGRPNWLYLWLHSWYFDVNGVEVHTWNSVVKAIKTLRA